MYGAPVAKTKKKSRKPAKKTARKPAQKTAAKGSVPLKQPHLRWLDSVTQSIRVNGGPAFSREDVLEALIDAASSREIDPRVVRDQESLRVAFGALDTSELEAQLREKRGGSVEPSVLDALKDSIK